MENLRTFEEMYAAAGDDLATVPWANLAPLPQLVEWLDGDGAAKVGELAGRRGRGQAGAALVVGSGYGDDAEELARRGLAVSAFDLSPTAVARARERFPRSAVDYRVADVTDLPAEWRGRFDLVIEVRTLQSLPVEMRAAAAGSIAAAVAPGGLLWLFALGRRAHRPGETRPWPVVEEELKVFEAAGLSWESRHEEPRGRDLYEVVGVIRRAAAPARSQPS